MNYNESIFKLLNIRPMEKFKVKETPDSLYRIDIDLKIQISYDENGFKWYYLENSLHKFLNGTFTIEKIKEPKTELERLAIEYAKACKMKWLAKDGYGDIIAFSKKPVRGTNRWLKDTHSDKAIEIGIPLSFLKWEDEPYYIGD